MNLFPHFEVRNRCKLVKHSADLAQTFLQSRRRFFHQNVMKRLAAIKKTALISCALRRHYPLLAFLNMQFHRDETENSGEK